MSGSVANWLERFLGVDTSAAGEGTAWGLANSWTWAPWILLVFAVVVALGIGWFYWMESGPAGRLSRVLCASLRLCAIALVLFMIAEWLLTLHRTGLPYVVLLVDDSASMGIADRYDDEKLRRLIADRLKNSRYDEASRFNLARSLVLGDNARLLRYL